MTSLPLIYDAAMGAAIERLAEPVRAFHRAPAPARFVGRASVARGSNPLARIVASVMGLPPSSPDCEVEVLVTRDDTNVETWRRTFAGRAFVSSQLPGRGRWQGLIVERIGPMAFAYAVIERRGKLHLDIRGWSASGIPMPAFLGPGADAFEHGADGRFNFDVAMLLPVIGLVVHYRGWLAPADAQGDRSDRRSDRGTRSDTPQI